MSLTNTLLSFFKRHLPYICIGVVLLVIVCVPDIGFAQTADDQSMTDLDEYYTGLLRLLSRAWVVPAVIAGKLMSNDFVFGAAFNMDVILRGLRNVVRTFVNFLVGFWFLKIIGSALISMDVKGMFIDVLRLFLAAILIQSSRFIMSVLVDFGTATTAAVGGLAQSVFADDREKDKNYLLAPGTIQVKEGGIDEQYNNFTISGSVDFTLDQILPSADSVAGPMLFIGASILEFTKATTLSTDAQGEISQRVTNSLLKLGVIIMYMIPVILLAVVAVVRLVWLWLWIILAPLIMFDRAMKIGGGQGGIKGLTEKVHATPGEVLGLIFVPTAVVGCMSIGLILIVSMHGVISQRGDYSEASIESFLQETKPAIIQGGASATAQIDGSLFKDVGYRAAGITGELLLAMLTIAILRGLVKVGFSVSSVTKSLTDKAFDAAKKLAITTPFIPLGDYGSTSLGGLGAGKKGGAVETFANYMGIDREQREQNNKNRAAKMTSKFSKSYDIDLSTLRDIRSDADFVRGTPGSLNAAASAVAGDDNIGGEKGSGSVEYTGNIQKMITEWLDGGAGTTTEGYGYIQNLLPSPDKGTMTREEFVNSPYMAKFLQYVFSGKDVSKAAQLTSALQRSTTAGSTGRYQVQASATTSSTPAAATTTTPTAP